MLRLLITFNINADKNDCLIKLKARLPRQILWHFILSLETIYNLTSLLDS